MGQHGHPDISGTMGPLLTFFPSKQDVIRAPGIHLQKPINLSKLPLMKGKVKGAE
jgi:hypothetical protein